MVIAASTGLGEGRESKGQAAPPVQLLPTHGLGCGRRRYLAPVLGPGEGVTVEWTFFIIYDAVDLFHGGNTELQFPLGSLGRCLWPTLHSVDGPEDLWWAPCQPAALRGPMLTGAAFFRLL